MDGFRSVLHRLSTGTEASIQWDVGVSKTALNPSMSTKTAIVSSLARAVFAFCQQAMVSMKEGDCDSQEEEEEEEVDVVEETGVGADEASLHRLGGFALYALIKAHQKSANPDVLSILKSIRMPLDAKAVDLPSNIQHLDKGGMTFMKKEMLGYLAMVHQQMRARSTKEFFGAYGAQSMKVMETEIKADEQLRRNFVFSCGEIGIAESSVLKEIHEKLLDRMLHTHGNELVQNRRMLTNLQEGRVDAPVMLRECLKVVAATNSKQLYLPDL